MWQFRVDHYFHPPHCDEPCGSSLAQIRAAIFELKGLIMASQTQLAADIAAVTANVAKIGEETSTLLVKIAELQAAVEAAGGTTPEVDAKMEALRAQVAVVDKLVQDAPPPAS